MILDPSGIRDVFLVMSAELTGGVLDRLQGQALLKGMSRRGCRTSPVAPETLSGIHLPAASCLLFFYEDAPAAEAVRAAVAASRVAVVACLCSDIYGFDEYIALHNIVDLYIAPTHYHQRVLSGQLYKPVYMLPETVDPIASPQGGVDVDRVEVHDYTQRDGRGTRTCWFGHAESFNKSMASLIPVIRENLENGSIQAFRAILNEDKFDNLYDIVTSDYTSSGYWSEAQTFGYCILSHLSLDLSLNTFIKSPNKAITALFSGLIPIASDTPNYRALLHRFGLDRFIFAGPRDLDAILRKLDPVGDWLAVKQSGILETLVDELSADRIAAEFVRILDQWGRNDPSLFYENVTPEVFQPAKPGFGYHARELLPSAYRAVARRFGGRAKRG